MSEKVKFLVEVDAKEFEGIIPKVKDMEKVLNDEFTAVLTVTEYKQEMSAKSFSEYLKAHRDCYSCLLENVCGNFVGCKNSIALSRLGQLITRAEGV